MHLNPMTGVHIRRENRHLELDMSENVNVQRKAETIQAKEY
jgi:hypothetical protein